MSETCFGRGTKTGGSHSYFANGQFLEGTGLAEVLDLNVGHAGADAEFPGFPFGAKDDGTVGIVGPSAETPKIKSGEGVLE